MRARASSVGPWVLVRPTSIWGPWFGEPYRRFFESVLAGRYVHPGRHQPPKALGYVGNVVAQIMALLDHDGSLDGETVYLADTPSYSIREWADAIRGAAGAKPARTVPVPLLRVGAVAGDLLQRVGVMAEPPLTSFRLDNMLTGSEFPSERLLAVTGPLPYTMEEGVAETVAWLRQQSAGRSRADR